MIFLYKIFVIFAMLYMCKFFMNFLNMIKSLDIKNNYYINKKIFLNIYIKGAP